MEYIIESQLTKIRSIQTDDSFNFLFFSDAHFTSTSLGTEIDVINRINKNIELSCVICCGDILGNSETKQKHLDTAANITKLLIQASPSPGLFFPVKGNHDDNSHVAEHIDNIRHTMLPHEHYDIMFKHLESRVITDKENSNGLYYYYDSSLLKVRYIILNSVDIPYIRDSVNIDAWKYSGQSNYAYSSAQLNWLAHTALSLPDDDWKVLLFTHVNPFLQGMIGADDLAKNSDVLIGIIQSFQSAMKWSSVPTYGDFAQNVQVDYSKGATNRILGLFYGHTHSEQVFFKNGITYISTWNDWPYKPKSNPKAPERIIGANSEICLNVVTINTSLNKIYMTKFGAGNDVDI